MCRWSKQIGFGELIMINRKEKILIGALELLEEGGINNVTTKKMAAQQGVSEPALYRQFKGKLEIVKHIIDEYASFDEKIMATISQSTMTGFKAIEYYVKMFSELYRTYSEITTVMFSMDVYFYEVSTLEQMRGIRRRRLDFLENLIGKEQKNGNIDNSADPEMLAEMTENIIFGQTYKWRLYDRESNLDEDIMRMIKRVFREEG